ncbi:hypothetical protein OAP25_03505 [Flavobacteriaceae bacterium]|nr:hypothetical protein [Flavobacteriaceae bacterium]
MPCQVYLSSNNRTGEARRRLKSGSFKAQAILERRNTDDTAWIIIDDLDSKKGIDWEKRTKRDKYAEFTRVPPAGKIDFTLINENGKYSEGSGTALEGVIDNDTKIRLRAGYNLTEPATPGVKEDITSDGFTYYMTYSGSDVILSPANADGNPLAHFGDLFDTFGDILYSDNPNYTPAGYTVFTKDFLGRGFSKVQQIRVTCNSDKGTIYYRGFNNLASDNSVMPATSWVNAGSTIDGLNKIDISTPTGCRYFEVAIIWDEIPWDGGEQIEQVDIIYFNYIDWVYSDVFYLDTPSFSDPNSPGIPDIKCSGRDIWKRAQEIDINVPDLSSGYSVDEVIKLVADRCNIKYSATSIADLSFFGSRSLSTGLKDVEKAFKVFEKCVQFINQEGSEEYRLYLKYDDDFADNILFVEPRFQDYETDFVFNHNHYTSIGSRQKNYDKLLQRATIFATKPVVGAEQLKFSDLGSTTTGVINPSWSGSYIYKRFEFTTSAGGFEIDSIDSWDLGSASLTISATGAGGTYDLKIYGCSITSGGPVDEWVSLTNMLAGKGITAKILNQFVANASEAQGIAKGLISQFETPVKEARNLKYPYLNLQLDLNYLALIWSRQLFLDDIHGVTGLKFHWDMTEKPADTTQYNLEDIGRNFEDINPDGYIYDSVLRYDIGYVYGMKWGPQGDAETARASLIIINNIGTVDQ